VRLVQDLVGAFGLLTRLPVGHLAPLGEPGRCVWAYPLVGAVVGAIGAGVYAALHTVGVAPALAAIWSVAAMLLATGGMHEDGLADTADGFGGGASRARKLEIMRDSRIGSFGALALLLSTVLRVAAIALLARPADVAAALLAAGVLGRGAMLLPLALLAPARSDGLGASLGRPPAWALALGLAVALALALALRGGLAAAGVAVVAGAAMAWLAWRQVGGITGDVLGATAVATECAVLTVLS